MVKRILVLTVALVLQYASVVQAVEPESSKYLLRDPTLRVMVQLIILTFLNHLQFLALRGNTSAILAQLQNDLELARNQTAVPGMGVAIIHKGKLIFAEGFGKRNKNDPFTPEVRSIRIWDVHALCLFIDSTIFFRMFLIPRPCLCLDL